MTRLISPVSNIAASKISLASSILGTYFWARSDHAIHWGNWKALPVYLQGAFQRMMTYDLQDVIVARIFSAVLRYITSLLTKLSVVSVADGFTPTNLVISVRKMSLAISSHRHSTAGSWNGNYGTLPKIPFQTNGIPDFVIKVISFFYPTRLAATRRLASGGIQRIPEARYQDEFHKTCHIYSKGSVLTFPEYGTAQGRVDFYIPGKEWGVLSRAFAWWWQTCGTFWSLLTEGTI